MSASHPEGIVLLVSARPTLWRELEQAFRGAGLPITAEPDLARGLRRAIEERPSLVLVDGSLPGTALIEALRHVRSFSPVPLIAIGSRRDGIHATAVLESGADDCVCDPIVPVEVLARARAVLRRVERGRDGLLAAGGIEVSRTSRTARVNGRTVNLTSAEFDVLALLAQSAGRIVPREQLVETAFHRESSPLDRALDVHISRLRRKLHPHARRIVTVRGVGYMLAADLP